MTWAKRETIERLFGEACRMPVVDAHTHIQDDIPDFSPELAAKNLAGTQASVNAYPERIINSAILQRRLVRRTMMDVAHGAFYSWFAQVAEGRRGQLDAIIEALGRNSAVERKRAGSLLMTELGDSRFSEYAEWLRFMFRLYTGDDCDPLDPALYETVCEAVARQRNEPAFAAEVLARNNVIGYVTSIENRDKIPLDPLDADFRKLDFRLATHPEAFNMFDVHYLLWPEGATDFGLFFAGHKYEAEKYLVHLERAFGVPIRDAASFREAIKEFLFAILYSPTYNHGSRVRYANFFQPIDFRLTRAFDIAHINTAIRYRKNCLRGDDLRHLTALATTATLEALDEIGLDLKRSGASHGSCFQIAVGVTYFMDTSREVQSFPVYAAGLPQDEYAAWTNYRNIHFEYIVAHEQLYSDLANAAKQVGNVSVGPWWHFFRKRKIASMMVDQLSMGPISAIASGFTDARFVEMLAAKYQSVRWAVSAALAEFVDDPASSMTFDQALGAMREILLINPCRVHHLPFLQ